MSEQDLESPVEEEVILDPVGNEVNLEPDQGKPLPLIDYFKELDDEQIDLRCWIRLPNSFEHREIQQKGLASRARKLRECRTAGSDAEAMVDQAMTVYEDMTDEELVNYLLEYHRRDKLFEASLIVEEDDKYEQIDYVKDEYDLKIRQGDVESEEFKTLESILVEYADALTKEVESLISPFKGKYDQFSTQEMLNKIRKSVVMNMINDEFTNVYAQWQIFYGTRKKFDHRKKYFKSFDELRDAPPRIIDMLVSEFAVFDALKSGELKKSLAATPSLLSSVPSES